MCLCLLVCLWSRNPGYWPMNLAGPVNLEVIFALWRLNPQLPCALQSWIIFPYLFIFSYLLFRAFVWPIYEVRGRAHKYCINDWPFPFYDLTTLINWLYSPSLFFSKLHFNVACLTPEVWWMFRKQKRYELFKIGCLGGTRLSRQYGSVIRKLWVFIIITMMMIVITTKLTVHTRWHSYQEVVSLFIVERGCCDKIALMPGFLVYNIKSLNIQFLF